MLDLHHIFTMQKRALFFLLAICAIGWAATSYETVFAGIALGALFGTYNFWILVRRMDKFDRSISEGTKTTSLGTLLRFASGVAAVALAMTIPEHFNVASTVIGLMLPYVFLYLERIVSHLRNH